MLTFFRRIRRGLLDGRRGGVGRELVCIVGLSKAALPVDDDIIGSKFGDFEHSATGGRYDGEVNLTNHPGKVVVKRSLATRACPCRPNALSRS